MPLCTKVRWKYILGILPLVLQLAGGSLPKCDKTPSGQQPYRTPGDNGFAISVAGAPTLYRPNQEYTITLAGYRLQEGAIEPTKVKFIDFLLVVESHLPATEVPNLGTLQLQPGENMLKFSHKCSHAVKATSAIPKDEIQVLWTAPEAGHGCIQLKAMVVERKDVWYMDDGALTYTICEDNSPMGTPPLVEPCCACDEAKYEVIFEGLWSRHTHPKDYPIDEWKTQFSHLIGASHSIDYDLWKYGELASPALTMLSVTGQTKKLEMDMKQFSKHIRSVIKARGLHVRSNVVGRTFAVFRMDPTNHLLSLVSKMIPSPDWIVGVSMENLCLANCSWVDSRVVDLYPWDSGVMSGITYNVPGEETMPRESIRRITACSPDNPDSPFYDPSCAPLKPVARLHILKQREYKKQCPNGSPGIPLNPSWGNQMSAGGGGNDNEVYSGNGIGPTPADVTNQYGDYNAQTYNDYSSGSSYGGSSAYGGGYSSNGDLCEMKEWTEWTKCSQTCGTGSQSRTRVWQNPIGANIANCPKEKLFSKRTCENPTACPYKSFQNHFDPFSNVQDMMSGYTSTWLQKGLSAGNLKKEVEPGTKSYVYAGTSNSNDNNNRQDSSSSYSYQSAAGGSSSLSDPYYDPYNKYSGYAKQKGYPPITNIPGSSNYNPYKAMGYFGYTYGGPPTGHYSQSHASNLPMNNDFDMGQVQGDSTTVVTCETEEWGSWSDCSTACGDGTRSRKRYYKESDTATCSEDLYQIEDCHEESGCQAPALPTPERRRRRKYNRKGPFSSSDPQCAVAEWTDWSPCSVSCGHGYNIRTRVFTLSFVPNRVCEGVRLTERRDCRPATCPWPDYNYDDIQPSYGHDAYAADEDNTVAIKLYDEPSVKEPYCNEDPDPGLCRAGKTRWYYNAREGNCQEFKYSGCGGNRNSFETEQACMNSCHLDRSNSAFKDLMPMSLVLEDYVDDQPSRQPVDCQVTEWSDWSSCSAFCGKGWITKTREILALPQNGGKACPKKLEKRKKCRGSDCATDPADWYQGNWRMLQDNNDDGH